jgi:predicted DNA-binding transcriptional regulator AlpA
MHQVRPARTSYSGAKIAAPEMASYLGISRVRVYQLIKAGLPLTSFEEATAWRAGRRPGHPRKITLDPEVNPANNTPGSNAAVPETGPAQTETQFLALNSVIKGLAQACTISDSNWAAMSSAFRSFDTLLLQVGVKMQNAFGTTISAALGPQPLKVPLVTECGELAASLQIIAQQNEEREKNELRQKNEERAAAEKRLAEQYAADKHARFVQSSRPSLNQSTPVKSSDAQLASSSKPFEKTSRKSSKQIEVVVEVASDDEEHIDGVTDWIAALMHARHLLPGGAHVKTSASAPTSEPNAHAAEVQAAPVPAVVCPLDVTLTIEDLRRQVAACQVDVQRGAAESAALHAAYKALSDKASSKALALKTKLDASASFHSNKVKVLAELEAQLAAQDKCIEESLANVPLDTRSQFIVEVRCLFDAVFSRVTSHSCTGPTSLSEGPSVMLPPLFSLCPFKLFWCLILI